MKRRWLFAICWFVCTAMIVVLPHFDLSQVGRLPSATYPLDGATDTAIKHQYLVFPKVHHSEFAAIRENVSKIFLEINDYVQSQAQAQELYDSLVDFASPITVVVMPPAVVPCSSTVERYKTHAVALTRALKPYWQRGGTQLCTEIIVSVVDREGDQHLDFHSTRRETGRVLILNNRGGALAQIILWRDDNAKVNNSQVQQLDPQLDIGSGFSILPLDWPRVETHRDDIRAMTNLRLPKDPYLTTNLKQRGLLPWSCQAQLLGIDYRDSWGRKAKSQWCYGDAFPKIIENDHYYAFRVEQ